MSSRWTSKLLLSIVLITSLWSRASKAQFPPTIDLTQTSADVTVLGAATLDKLGLSFTSCDVNGDNYLDWVLFSGGASPLGRQGVGMIDILWGGTALDSTIDLLNFQGNVSKIFPSTGDFGELSRLASGDFNKDGFGDIVLGVACQYPSFSCKGKAYIIFGCSAFPDTLDLENPSVDVTTISGSPWDSGWLGIAATRGDINGDTYDDLVIAAPFFDPGGEVYIIYGSDSFPATISLATAQPNLTRIIDEDYGWGTGRSLACADVDLDGYDDILIGSPGDIGGTFHGKGTLVFGAESLPDTILLSDESLRIKRIYSDDTQGGRLGIAVAIGDVNRDLEPDLILSASNLDLPGCVNCGVIYVIYSAAALPDSIHVNASEISMTRLVGAESETYGKSMVSGDITGDQYYDIIISSDPGNDPGDVHKVTVFYGSTNPSDSVFLAEDTTVTRICAQPTDGSFGSALGSADLNNDGIEDLYIGSFRAKPLGRSSGGKVYLFDGIDTTTAGPPTTPSFILHQNHPNPFSTSTTISYALAGPSPVTLTIYNVLGQRVLRMGSPWQSEGLQSFVWNGLDDRNRRVASGVYFYRVQAGQTSRTEKMLLIR